MPGTTGRGVPAPSLRVGMIGLGAIAQKAYLPVLTARPDVELHLFTRDRVIWARTSRRMAARSLGGCLSCRRGREDCSQVRQP
jgi:predicted dehydrogenase